MKSTEIKLGIWMAVLSALFAILWFVTFILKDKFQAVPEWSNLEAYAVAFQMKRLTYVYPSILLALSYVILLVCLHRIVSEHKKIWSLTGLTIGIIYSVMASINYNIQAVAVRLSLNAGETGGIEMFLPDNTHSVFNALANSYVYMAISMFFTGFIFKKGKLENWIRALLLVQVLSAAGQAGYSMFDFNESIFVVTSMIWVLGAPASFVLIAIWLSNLKTVS